MISVDQVRIELVSAFKAVHEANYPSVPANYPNLTVVDIERQRDPFVSVDIDITNMMQAALGERELLVPGFLNVYYYLRTGTGTTLAYQYTDMLNEYLGMTQIGALRFRPVVLRKIQTFPGWEGFMNSLQFDVVQSVTC